MMTAIAIVAPLLNPPDEPLPEPEALRADCVEEGAEEVSERVEASEAVGVTVTGDCVE